ncbi:MAG: ABC transporter ATP-binding protein [Aquihabitans sp.]
MSPLLEVLDLSVRYGGVVAVDGVSFDVEPGQVVGLIGPNGAGKTSCIDGLTGFHPLSRGIVRFVGQDVTDLPPHRRAHRGFVRTFQSLDLFEDLTVRQNLDVGATTPTWRDTLTDALRPRHRDTAAVDEALELVGIAELADRYPGDLSNGQRHLVALGRALVAKPRLVLLDEPAAGLDEQESIELGTLLRRLPERDITVLMVDHDMSLVLGVCDQINVLDVGRLVARGTPAEVRADPTVIAAYLGTSSAPTTTEAPRPEAT